MFSLKNKTAIITGGASGLGNSIVQTFLKQEAKVFVIDLNKNQLNELEQEINNPTKLFTYQGDLTDYEKIKEIINSISVENTIDILINNAGISFVDTIETSTEENFDRIYKNNVKSMYFMCKLVIPFMKKNATGGSIVNISSLAVKAAFADRFSYTVSKGAVNALTLSIAQDCLPYNIRCNNILPTRISTPLITELIKKNYSDKAEEVLNFYHQQQPLKRMCTPQEVAALALYLASDEAACLSGGDFCIDGGYLNLRNSNNPII